MKDNAGRFDISSSYSEVRRAADWLRHRTEGVLDEERTNDLELAAVEALTNIVRHAYAEVSGQMINLELTCTLGELSLLIRDRGQPPPADLLTREPPDDKDPSDEIAESGRGVMIIRACVDAAAFERQDGETLLSLTLFLSTPG